MHTVQMLELLAATRQQSLLEEAERRRRLAIINAAQPRSGLSRWLTKLAASLPGRKTRRSSWQQDVVRAGMGHAEACCAA